MVDSQAPHRAPEQQNAGRAYAEAFALLQELYPKPDGSKWRPVDLQRATGGLVKTSWMTAFTKGIIKRPGMAQLEAIARVMGFPFDLWRLEPDQWPGRPEERKGRSLQHLLGRLFEAQDDPRTGEPFSAEEVAARSGGRVTAEQVRRMLAGELTDPTRNQLRGLSDAFGVRPSYWFGGPAVPLLDPKTEAAVREAARSETMKEIVHRSVDLSEKQKDIVVLLLEQLAAAEGDDPAGQ